MKEQLIQRYSAPERINHWVVAVCFVLLAISGLAFFYPAFFWLTGVFGTPQLARIVHPFVGVVMFLAFARQFFRYWHHNLITPEDVKWMKSVKEVMKGNEVGDIGKYNGGQKGMFWLMCACMAVLIPIQAIARLIAHDRAGFDALIGSLRVTEEIEQSGVENPAAGAESRS